jgi:hypothetical protein
LTLTEEPKALLACPVHHEAEGEDGKIDEGEPAGQVNRPSEVRAVDSQAKADRVGEVACDLPIALIAVEEGSADPFAEGDRIHGAVVGVTGVAGGNGQEQGRL